jgi:hypothetical protein
MTNSNRTNRWLAGSGLALLALCGLGCADESANPPMADVDASFTCDSDADGALRARGSVTNHSSKPSFYVVTIDFTVDGRSFESATGTVDDVAPGETAPIEVAAFEAPEGDLDCFVSDVDRFKA